jgi:hypothetical protein
MAIIGKTAKPSVFQKSIPKEILFPELLKFFHQIGSFKRKLISQKIKKKSRMKASTGILINCIPLAYLSK